MVGKSTMPCMDSMGTGDFGPILHDSFRGDLLNLGLRDYHLTKQAWEIYTLNPQKCPLRIRSTPPDSNRMFRVPIPKNRNGSG